MIDVCLLLEGTYPYVAGGVSTWVHQLIGSMKDIRFGIVYIAPHADPTRTLKYEVPNHVIYLKDLYLHDYNLSSYRRRRPTAEDYDLMRNFFLQSDTDTGLDLFTKIIMMFRGDRSCFDGPTLFSAKKMWELLKYFYRKTAGDVSLIDYFWTWRGSVLPVFQILQGDIPEAKVYHSVSTGYAGLLGAMARELYSAKYFLTEHGIYTHERMLEISQANWLFEKEKHNFRAERDLSYFKQWWIKKFSLLSRIAYHYADQIFTLYEGNKIREILEGANAGKITIIPNGIDLKKYAILVTEKKQGPQIGLVGRVVGIKDIKTFIQASRIVLQKLPDAQFYVVGPRDEEPDYDEECQRLVEALNLEDHIFFTGRVDSGEYYKFLDLVVLTSLSEAQPYVILEAGVMGIPVVATNVGACRELLEGGEAADRVLGFSGLVTEVANPQNTAEAILRLLGDKKLYQQMSAAGRERVKKFYDEDDLLSRYLNIYEQNI